MQQDKSNGSAGAGATDPSEQTEAKPSQARQTEAKPTPAGQAGREAGDPDAALGAEDLGDLPQRFADAEARANANHDRYLRAVAEMENLRRRMQDDVARAHKFGIESFAESLLAVRDSLELALKVEQPTVENLREGVEMTLKQLATVFEKNRIVAIDPIGEKFDPNRHQAISTVAAAQTKPPTAPNHVAIVLQKGYLIHERVLRPALVVVAQG